MNLYPCIFQKTVWTSLSQTADIMTESSVEDCLGFKGQIFFFFPPSHISSFHQTIRSDQSAGIHGQFTHCRIERKAPLSVFRLGLLMALLHHAKKYIVFGFFCFFFGGTNTPSLISIPLVVSLCHEINQSRNTLLWMSFSSPGFSLLKAWRCKTCVRDTVFEGDNFSWRPFANHFTRREAFWWIIYLILYVPSALCLDLFLSL